MAFLEDNSLRTNNAKHLRDSVTGRMQALITIHDQFFHDGTGLVAVEEPARLDGVEGFARKADRMRHIIRYGDNGTRRWYPRRSALNEYIEFGRPEYWTGTQWSLLPMGTPTVTDSKLVWDRQTYALTVQHNWHRVKLDVTLKSSAAARRIRWPVTLQGLDRSGDNLISQSDGKIVGYINKPTAFDSTTPQPKAIPVTMSYSAGYVEFNADLTGAVYPVTIDPTLTSQPDATAGKDGPIYNDSTSTETNSNFGTDTALDALYNWNGGAWAKRRALVEFDISSIPGTATVDSAVYSHTCRANSGAGETDLHRITRSWTEMGSTWNKYDGTNAWSTAGGDFDGTASASINPASYVSGTVYDFTITSLVQSLVNGTYTNYGFLLKQLTESGTGVAYLAGYSSDHTTANQRPKLEVVYETGGIANMVPVGTRSLLGVGR